MVTITIGELTSELDLSTVACKVIAFSYIVLQSSASAQYNEACLCAYAALLLKFASLASMVQTSLILVKDHFVRSNSAFNISISSCARSLAARSLNHLTLSTDLS